VGEEPQTRGVDDRMNRIIGGESCFVSVISHKRSASVSSMQEKCGEATWFVGRGEGREYAAAGAACVVESGALCRSRNAALDAGFADCEYVVELSDDLGKLHFAESKDSKRELKCDEAVDFMLKEMKKSGARLAGMAPTANSFYFNPLKPIQTNGFIVGDMIAVRRTPLRFDEAMSLKEDYDYTLQHIKQYGVVVRLNAILATFAHRTNRGGACSYRTAALEQKMIDYLKSKWPGMVRDNPRRPNEILIR
jgi:hypothetical protein